MDELERIKAEQASEPSSQSEGNVQPAPQKKKRIIGKPTAFERRVEARAMDQVTKALEERLDQPPLTDPVAGSPEEQASASGPEDAKSPFAQALRLLQNSELASNPRGLRLLADLTELVKGTESAPIAKASHIIQPSGGGLPAPDLRGEYERRLRSLRPGDVAGLMEVKREFRKRGLEVW